MKVKNAKEDKIDKACKHSVQVCHFMHVGTEWWWPNMCDSLREHRRLAVDKDKS